MHLNVEKERYFTTGFCGDGVIYGVLYMYTQKHIIGGYT